MTLSVEEDFTSPGPIEIDEALDTSFRQDPEESKLQKSGLIARIFPTGFKHELVELFKFSWPIVCSQFFSSFIRISMVMFAGHLGKIQLGAATLAVSLANMVGNSISIGLISACDTYFSQSYGSPNKFQVGVYLQTALYITFLSCVVSFAPLINIQNIMLHLGQNPEIALYTEQFLLIYLPALFAISLYQLLTRYIVIQGYLLPSVLVGLVSNIIHVIMQYVLTYVVNLGLGGSVSAMVLACMCMAIGLLLYVLVSKVYRYTWSGWTKASLQDWGKFMKLGLSSVMMLSIEWWTFEISFFLMGILGAVDIGASSIMYQLWSFYTAASKGIGSACAYRVGRYLGATRVKGALTAARVAIVVSYSISIINAAITLAFRNYLPYIFTSDPDVIEMAKEMLPILAVFSFFGSSKDICAGIVRGTGKQVLGGVVTFVSFILIALPIGIPLMFYTSAGAAGFWWGLNIGLVVASTSLITIVLRVDWGVESEKALERAKVTRKKKTDDSSTPEKKGTTKDGTMYGSIELVFVTTAKRSPAYWRCLIAKRVAVFILCFAILAFGIIARCVLFIPPPLVLPNTNTTNFIPFNSTNEMLEF